MTEIMPLLHIDATPNAGSPLMKVLDDIQCKRAKILDKAIKILEKEMQ